MRKQSRWLMLATIIGAALAMLAFSACGGDDDNGGSTTTARATNTGSGGDATHAPDDTGDSGDNGGGSLADLENLSNDLNNVTGKVTYNITADDGSTSSMTFYAKPPNSRFDSTDSDGTSSIIITTPAFTYICDSSSQSCFSTPGSGDDTSSLGAFGAFLSPEVINTYIQLADAAGVDVNTSDESINGIDAKCYSWQPDTTDIDAGKICFNDAGIMVYEQFGDGVGSSTLKASDVSSDVSDSDFEPPYPVTTLPGA